MLFNDSVRTSKRTPHLTITKINWLMLFKKIIADYSENHGNPINTKCSITDCQSRWFILLPLGLKGLTDAMLLEFKLSLVFPSLPLTKCSVAMPKKPNFY
jgi:hypothetical protein